MGWLPGGRELDNVEYLVGLLAAVQHPDRHRLGSTGNKHVAILGGCLHQSLLVRAGGVVVDAALTICLRDDGVADRQKYQEIFDHINSADPLYNIN